VSLRGASLVLPEAMPEGLLDWTQFELNVGDVRVSARPTRYSNSSGQATNVVVAWTASPQDIERILVGLLGGELLYKSERPSREKPGLAITVLDVSDEIKRYLARYPGHIHHLTPHRFEELIASILRDLGLDVEITQATRDGGVDIYAYVRSQVASFLMLVECKKWAPERPIGIDVVQRLYGIQQGTSANKSMVVTTSYFTRPAQEQCRQYYPLMELRDFEDIKNWLRQVSSFI